MATVVVLALMSGQIRGMEVLTMTFMQVSLGLLGGGLIAWLGKQFFLHFPFNTEGFDLALLLAFALMGFSVPTLLGGNGYLGAYVVGLYLGNQNMPNKRGMVHFFDGTATLMQIVAFFVLGLLATPSKIPDILPEAIGAFLIITFISRPVAVFGLLIPFKSTLNQKLLIAWTGFRGAASIVFAVFATVHPATGDYDIYHVVFCIVIISIAVQGSSLPWLSRRLDMIDDREDVMKTFTDYSADAPINFVQLKVSEEHPWADRTLSEIVIPPGLLAVAVVRGEQERVPDGSTRLQVGDVVVLTARELDDSLVRTNLLEQRVEDDNPHIGQPLSRLGLGPGRLIVMIQRGDEVIIPGGDTVIQAGDLVVFTEHRQRRA